MSRVFKYKEREFADPGEHFTNEEILAILSKTFPELVGGKIATTTSADGTATVTFEPKPKRNGADVPPLKIAVLAHREAKAREAAKAAEAERLAKAAEEAEKMTLELAIRPKLIAYFIDRAGVKLEERQLRIDFPSMVEQWQEAQPYLARCDAARARFAGMDKVTIGRTFLGLLQGVPNGSVA